jgi:hypothetical protein
MATTLIGSVRVTTQWSYSNGLTIGAAQSTDKLDYLASFAQGTGLNQADTLYVSYGTLGASGALNIDMTGALFDIFGNSVAMARVKSMHIVITTATPATSVLVGNGTNPLLNWVGAGSHTIRIRNGGCFCLSAPDATAYAVTASTGDILKLLNEDGVNTATYQVAFMGSSA